MASIKFDNVSFAYGNNQILRNFSLEVDDSQIMCLVGPSGCGTVSYTHLWACQISLRITDHFIL